MDSGLGRRKLDKTICRRRVAIAYTVLIALVTFSVVVQGFLFSGFIAGEGLDYRDAHGLVGTLVGFIMLVVVIPLAFVAKFPKQMRIGWWTVGLTLLYNVQGHVLGFGIEDVRSLEMIHIPVAFLIFGISIYLTGRVYAVLRASGA